MPIQKPDFGLSKEYQQLALELDLPEVEAEGVSPEEAKRRSETARAIFQSQKGTPGQPSWFGEYERLSSSGWPWRQAAYVAWASTPKEGRTPKTQDELAQQHLGLTSDRAISTWRKRNPAIDQTVTLLQSAPLWEYRADSFKQLIDGMLKAGKDYKFFNHLKLYAEMTGDYIPLTQLAAVLRQKSISDPSSVPDSVLKELEEATEEIREKLPKAPLSPGGDIPPSAPQIGGEGKEGK